MLQSMAGLDLVHVPYKGEGPALVDLVAGRVDIFIGNLAAPLKFHQSHRANILAEASTRRTPVLPDVQRRIFEGPVWNCLCLETEIPKPGDWRSTHLGAMPVVVVRDLDAGIRAFENRCAHRGALICIEDAGNVQRAFHCIYHAW